jgi:hypothetical protein
LACFASSEVLIYGNISAPWVKFAKDILDNCGLSNVWTFQNINFNTDWVIAYVKLRLRDHFLLLFHLPVSMGNFVLVVLNLQKVKMSLFSKILK